MDVDIYEDLSFEEHNVTNDFKKLQEELKDSEAHVQVLETDIENLHAKIAEMKKIQENLAKNISELYKTAKSEIERKDRIINKLRLQLEQHKNQNKFTSLTVKHFHSDPHEHSTVKRSKENECESRSRCSLNPRIKSRSHSKSRYTHENHRTACKKEHRTGDEKRQNKEHEKEHSRSHHQIKTSSTERDRNSKHKKINENLPKGVTCNEKGVQNTRFKDKYEDSNNIKTERSKEKTINNGSFEVKPLKTINEEYNYNAERNVTLEDLQNAITEKVVLEKCVTEVKNITNKNIEETVAKKIEDAPQKEINKLVASEHTVNNLKKTQTEMGNSNLLKSKTLYKERNELPQSKHVKIAKNVKKMQTAKNEIFNQNERKIISMNLSTTKNEEIVHKKIICTDSKINNQTKIEKCVNENKSKINKNRIEDVTKKLKERLSGVNKNDDFLVSGYAETELNKKNNFGQYLFEIDLVKSACFAEEILEGTVKKEEKLNFVNNNSPLALKDNGDQYMKENIKKNMDINEEKNNHEEKRSNVTVENQNITHCNRNDEVVTLLMNSNEINVKIRNKKDLNDSDKADVKKELSFLLKTTNENETNLHALESNNHSENTSKAVLSSVNPMTKVNEANTEVLIEKKSCDSENPDKTATVHDNKIKVKVKPEVSTEKKNSNNAKPDKTISSSDYKSLPESKSKKSKDGFPKELKEKNNIKKEKSEEEPRESDRVLRSATRRTSSKDKLEKSNEDQENQKRENLSDKSPKYGNSIRISNHVVSPTAINNKNSVNLTHDGEIPVLHISEGDQSPNHGNFLNNVNMQHFPSAVTSTPLNVHQVNMQLMKQDLNISLDCNDSKNTDMKNSNMSCNSSTLNGSSNNDLNMKTLNTSSPARKRRRVRITLID